MDRAEVEIGVALARLVHDDLELCGTGHPPELSQDEMRTALLALHEVAKRLGIAGFAVPFRDFATFENDWKRKGASGSYQARRDILHEIFEPLHEKLAELEAKSLSSTLSDPVTSHARTGWPAVDTEVGELRRHFQNAGTPQDYRGVGNDCLHVTEVLSRQVYDPARHLRVGESEPPVTQTKQRLERFVEDAAPCPDNATLRKLSRATIEMAQHVKHSSTPTRREAGIAADAIIQLVNILRRLDEPE